MEQHSLDVVHYPFAADNPYQKLMFDGVASHGITCSGINNGLRGLINEAVSGKNDVLHLHWIHGPVTFENTGGALIRLCAFHIALLVARLRGMRIVWTVHNLVHHERTRDWLDRLNTKLAARMSQAVLVHGHSVIPLVAKRLGMHKSKIRVVYHGNYEGVVRRQPPRVADGAVRFLFFGKIRPYKGIENLLANFRYLHGPHKLHIAGMSKLNELTHAIETEVAHDPDRVSAELAFVSDKRLEELLGWCDVVVLPYRDIFTSGSLLMAMTAGRPVIVPRIGLIPEYIDERAAFLYELNDTHGLKQAMSAAAQCDTLDHMANFAAQRAKDFDWQSIGFQLARIYQGQG